MIKNAFYKPFGNSFQTLHNVICITVYTSNITITIYIIIEAVHIFLQAWISDKEELVFHVLPLSGPKMFSILQHVSSFRWVRFLQLQLFFKQSRHRVMVLAEGQIVEMDTPGRLLQDSTSAFYKMARSAGLVG